MRLSGARKSCETEYVNASRLLVDERKFADLVLEERPGFFETDRPLFDARFQVVVCLGHPVRHRVERRAEPPDFITTLRGHALRILAGGDRFRRRRGIEDRPRDARADPGHRDSGQGDTGQREEDHPAERRLRRRQHHALWKPDPRRPRRAVDKGDARRWRSSRRG